MPSATELEYRLLDAKVPTRVFGAGEMGADIALAVHLFCFAESRAELLDMCRCVALNTRAGGRVICYSCASVGANRGCLRFLIILHSGPIFRCSSA